MGLSLLQGLTKISDCFPSVQHCQIGPSPGSLSLTTLFILCDDDLNCVLAGLMYLLAGHNKVRKLGLIDRTIFRTPDATGYPLTSLLGTPPNEQPLSLKINRRTIHAGFDPSTVATAIRGRYFRPYRC
jgi:hypothetical protein